jgi:tetratricopeptide (TPR) repeat protein
MLSLGEEEAARAFAERQRALLDEALRGAPPEVVMTFSWPAAEVYAFLGRPEALVPRLEANVEALPEAYDPPYRLAWLLLQADEPQEALPYAELALERVYGPRKARVYRLLASVHDARGDPEAAAAALERAATVLERLPEGQRDPDQLAEVRAALGARGGALSLGRRARLPPLR